MTLLTLLIIAIAAFVAGAVNSIAGGGTFISFPALTGAAGLSEKIANMTSTIGLWPGSAAGVVAAGPEFKRLPRGIVIAYGVISLIGGVIGSVLLLKTNDRTFRLVIPWLLAFATIVFGFSKPIARWAGHQHGKRTPGWTLFVMVMQFAVAVYGGYFGAGIGVLMLAGLSFAGLDDIHQMNALKVLLATVINGSAVVVFMVAARGSSPADALNWPLALAMVPASIIGGFFGMRVARAIRQEQLRAVVLVVGIVLTGVYFYRAYGG